LKLIEEYIGEILQDIVRSKDFLNRNQEINEMINKYNYIKLKSLCLAKEIVNRMRRQLTQWEKIFCHLFI
jgi:hypothetical protein